MTSKTKIFIILFALLLGLFSLSPLALAEVDPNVTGRGNNSNNSGNAGAGGGAQCETDDLCQGNFCRINGICVPKPKGNVGGLIGSSTVFEVVAIVLKWLLTLAGVIATVFLIIGGYQYLTSAGNEEASEKGKKTIVNAIIGIVVVVLSMAIVTIITNTLGSSEPLGDGTIYPRIV